MNTPPSLSIRAVAKRTGLSPFVIRSWEKRYHLAEPARSSGGHRLYSEAEVERLSLLARAVRSGLSIGTIVHIPDEELKAMLSKSEQASISEKGLSLPAEQERPIEVHAASVFFKELIEAAENFDGRRLNRVLDEAKVSLGWQGLIELVVSPVAAEIGRLWQSGELTIAQEHFFSAAVKVQLGSRVHVYSQLLNAPRIVIATPTGQMHELGAILTANAAANMGWEVAYIGNCVPAEEMAGAVRKFRAKVLAISMIFPKDDPALKGELHQLGRLVPEGTRIIAGGQAASSYTESLLSIGAVICGPLSEFVSILNSI